MRFKVEDVLPPEGGVARRKAPAVLRARGEDALAFLQGQFTQELRPSLAPTVQYGLWLNQKGKVLADSYVLRVSAEELWLVSHESPVATLRERLDAYIIADDVELEAVNAPWSAWLAVGARGREWLEANGVQPPAAGTWAACSGGWVFPSRLGVEAWELILPASSAATPAPIALTEQDVEAVRILRGVPAVPRDIGPADLPAEGRLDAIAVSYTKGCYLGQEVMARLKAMGRLRRQLRRLNGTGPCPPAGAELRQADRRIGEIRSAVELRGGGWVGMGMITLLGFRDDQAVAVEGLPATEGFVQPWDV